jgi:myosin V
LFLKNASDYNYLRHSNCLSIDGVDDAKKFSVLVVKIIASTEILLIPPPEILLALYLIVAYAISFSVQDALNTIQISKEDQMKLFSMLAAVLWLGNISFSVIDNESHVEVVPNEGTSSASL